MNDYDLWLASAELYSGIKIKLLDTYTCTENLWYHVINKKCHMEVNQNVINKLLQAWNSEKFNFIKQYIKNNNINVALYNDPLYPTKLKKLEDAPYILFYMGDISKLNIDHKSVAIVGSRHCTSYGVDVTNLIVKSLSENNITVISGMAKGIDSVAHRECIKNNGFTCAVLGCGIDVIYPKENSQLYRDIIREGCVVSEFLPGTKPYAYNFPIRNRIISGLSDVVVIVEAGIRSGSLITAGTALDQCREIVVVPGSVFSEQSKGTNSLIKDGADPFNTMEDIYRLLKIQMKSKKASETPALSKYEEKVNSIVCNNPVHIDDIIRITNIDIKLLYEVLFEMQLKEEIRCLAGNFYVRINNNL